MTLDIGQLSLRGMIYVITLGFRSAQALHEAARARCNNLQEGWKELERRKSQRAADM